VLCICMLSSFAFTLCGNILHVIPVCDTGVILLLFSFAMIPWLT
jgi:hypothetical protein